MISKERLEYLERCAFKLQCLEDGGVDHWGSYYDSLIEGGYIKRRETEEPEDMFAL